MGFAFPSDAQELIAGRMATGGYATEEDILRNALPAWRRRKKTWSQCGKPSPSSKR